METAQSTIEAPKPRPSAGIHSRQHFSSELLAPDMAGRSSCHAAGSVARGSRAVVAQSPVGVIAAAAAAATSAPHGTGTARTWASTVRLGGRRRGAGSCGRLRARHDPILRPHGREWEPSLDLFGLARFLAPAPGSCPGAPPRLPHGRRQAAALTESTRRYPRCAPPSP